jgi:hypothetical protein
VLLVKLHCKYERSFLLHEDVQNEKYPEIAHRKFKEMTLSPFVGFPAEEDVDDDDADVDDDDRSVDSFVDSVVKEADDDCADNDGADETATEPLPEEGRANGIRICPFEKLIFTSGMEDIKTRC